MEVKVYFADCRIFFSVYWKVKKIHLINSSFGLLDQWKENIPNIISYI